jgi:hypothetical protein
MSRTLITLPPILRRGDKALEDVTLFLLYYNLHKRESQWVLYSWEREQKGEKTSCLLHTYTQRNTQTHSLQNKKEILIAIDIPI